MPDLLYLAITVGFFVACAGFVTICDRIIGPDADHGDPQGAGEPDPEEAGDRAASTPDTADAVVAGSTS